MINKVMKIRMTKCLRVSLANYQTTKSDVTQQASVSTIPKSRTTRSGRQNIPDKKLDLWNEIWMGYLSTYFVLLKWL